MPGREAGNVSTGGDGDRRNMVGGEADLRVAIVLPDYSPQYSGGGAFA